MSMFRRSTTNTSASAITTQVMSKSIAGTICASYTGMNTQRTSIPNVPLNLTATLNQDNSVFVSWVAPIDDGMSKVVSYTISFEPIQIPYPLPPINLYASLLGNNSIQLNWTSPGPDVTSYTVSHVYVVSFQVPSAPTGVSAVAGNAQATVQWTVPVSNGGSAITAYTVTSFLSPSGVTGPTSTVTGSTATSLVVTGLLNGSAYRFSVRATNAIGNSLESAQTTPITPFAPVQLTVPSAPTSVIAVAGNAQATVQWIVPASNGGSAITGYTTTSFSYPSGVTGPSVAVTGSTTTTTPVTGLTNGSAYTFSVRATNAIGNSVESVRSMPVTPLGPLVGTIFASNLGVSGLSAGPLLVIDTLNNLYTNSYSNSSFVKISPTAIVTPYSNLSVQMVSTSYIDTIVHPRGICYFGTINSLNVSDCIGFISDNYYSGSPTAGNIIGLYSPGFATYINGQIVNAGSFIIGSNAAISLCADQSNIYFITTALNLYKYNNFTQPPLSILLTTLPTTVTNQDGQVFSCTDSLGNIYVSISFYHVILKVTPQGVVTDFAGSRVSRFEDGTGSNASFNYPLGIFCSSNNTLYVADSGNNAIRIITTPSATVRTMPVNDFNYPTSACLDTSGNIFVYDYGNAVIRKFSPSYLVTVPAAPTGVTAAAGNAQATVQWIVPTTNGGSAITAYTATAFLSPSGTTAQSASVTGSNATSVVITGLTNGSSYTFTVHATNAIGNSVESAQTTPAITPVAGFIPGAPTGVSAVGGNTQATVSWTVPASNGGSPITAYTARSFLSPSGVTGPIATVTGSNATNVVVTGLTNGTAYTFSAYATNAIGNSVDSARSSAITLSTVPGAPTSVTGVVGDGQITVSWALPASNGGLTISAYTVTSFLSPSGVTGPTATATGSTTTTATVTGLTNGTAYTFSVRATNAYGNSVESVKSAVYTPVQGGPPSPATNLVLNQNFSSNYGFGVNLGDLLQSWTNGSNLGTSIRAYLVSRTTGISTSVILASNSSGYIWPNTLIDGNTYYAYVESSNIYGVVVSAPSADVTWGQLYPNASIPQSLVEDSFGNLVFTWTLGNPTYFPLTSNVLTLSYFDGTFPYFTKATVGPTDTSYTWNVGTFTPYTNQGSYYYGSIWSYNSYNNPNTTGTGAYLNGLYVIRN